MATKMMDIALDSNSDLLPTNGDWAIVESTVQHQAQLIWSDKGEFKENPTVCVGVWGYIDDEDGMKTLARDVSKEFNRDGMQVDSMNIDATGLLTPKAYYP